MNTQNTLFDEEAAGRYIGGANSPVSSRTLQRWRLEGVGPVFVKLGRLVRYRQSDLEHFLNERARTSTSMTSPIEYAKSCPHTETRNV